jgi:hypothetical protein
MKFSMEGATPSFEDSDGQLVAAGVHIRLRIKGIRSELNQMFAIGSIREDFLGYEPALIGQQITAITDTRLLVLLCRVFLEILAPPQPVLVLLLDDERREQYDDSFFLLSLFVTSGVLQSGLQRGVGDTGREKGEERSITEARKDMFTFFHVVNQDTQPEQEKLFVQSFQSLPCQFRLIIINQQINNHPSPTKADKPPNAS